jgi:nucleotide-binding universal stress UspA family protein
MTSTMKQGTVVVGVDGSAPGSAALAWAVHHAVARRRPLLVVTAAGDPIHSLELLGPADVRSLLEGAARQVADRAVSTVRELAPDLDVEVATPLQDPREALLDGAERASMLVVGTRGRGPVRALLLGSVSTAVASHAPCPVAVVRAPQPKEAAGDESGDEAGRPVVVGTDGGAASVAALEFAFELAAAQGRTLQVVHSWSPYETFIDPDSRVQVEQLAAEHQRALAESLAGFGEKYPDVTVERHMPDAGAADTLVRMSTGASVVVIGSRGRTGVKAVLSSVSRDVVERAHSTVVVVRS